MVLPIAFEKVKDTSRLGQSAGANASSSALPSDEMQGYDAIGDRLRESVKDTHRLGQSAGANASSLALPSDEMQHMRCDDVMQRELMM